MKEQMSSRESATSQALSGLEARVADLEDLVSDLRAKAARYMRSAEPKPETNDKTMEPKILTPLREEIDAINHRVMSVRASLADVIERIEP